jgi:hypothetical protein
VFALYLRLRRSLVKNQIPYLAPSGRDRQATPDERAAAIRDTWIRPNPRVKRARQTREPGKGAKVRWTPKFGHEVAEISYGDGVRRKG